MAAGRQSREEGRRERGREGAEVLVYLSRVRLQQSASEVMGSDKQSEIVEWCSPDAEDGTSAKCLLAIRRYSYLTIYF